MSSLAGASIFRPEAAAMTEADLHRTTEAIRLKAGLRVLQTADPDIVQVLQRATFVSAYALDTSNEWARADIEGALYIVLRSTNPRYRLIILNQRTPQNLVEDITADWELSSQEHFIFFRIPNHQNGGNGMVDGSEARRVAGLWFSSEEERECVRQGIEDILRSQQQETSPAEEEEEEISVGEASEDEREDLELPRRPSDPQPILESVSVQANGHNANNNNFNSNTTNIKSNNNNTSKINHNIGSTVPSSSALAMNGGRKAGAAILSLLGVVRNSSTEPQHQQPLIGDNGIAEQSQSSTPKRDRSLKTVSLRPSNCVNVSQTFDKSQHNNTNKIERKQSNQNHTGNGCETFVSKSDNAGASASSERQQQHVTCQLLQNRRGRLLESSQLCNGAATYIKKTCGHPELLLAKQFQRMQAASEESLKRSAQNSIGAAETVTNIASRNPKHIVSIGRCDYSVDAVCEAILTALNEPDVKRALIKTTLGILQRPTASSKQLSMLRSSGH